MAVRNDDDGYIRETIGSIKASLENLAGKVSERYDQARITETEVKRTLADLQDDIGEIRNRVLKVEGDIKTVTESVDTMAGPVAQFVSLRQRAVGWGAFLTGSLGLAWLFASPVYSQLIKKLFP